MGFTDFLDDLLRGRDAAMCVEDIQYFGTALYELGVEAWNCLRDPEEWFSKPLRNGAPAASPRSTALPVLIHSDNFSQNTLRLPMLSVSLPIMGKL
jgi:hypothetical protein